MLGFALDCGSTTVRDVGGGDFSLWRAIEDGLIRAPRFFYAGKMLAMTGSHGDLRTMAEAHHEYCQCAASNSLCVIVDGIDECITAAREQLRCGVSIHWLADSSAPPADTASKCSSPRSAP